MIKRSFRFGLLVGLLGGLALALVKTLSGRGEEPASAPAPSSSAGSSRSAPWPRLEADPAVPAPPQERLVADPDAPAAPVPEPGPVRGPAAMAPPPAADDHAVPERPARDQEPDRPAAAAPAPTSADTGETASETRPRSRQGAAAKPRTSPAKAAAPKKATKKTASKAAGKTTKKATKKKAAAPRAWVEPDGEVCPTSHPVKAKLASKIFHVPGGLSYGRTRPDRCYKDEATAEADGLRPAKR